MSRHSTNPRPSSAAIPMEWLNNLANHAALNPVEAISVAPEELDAIDRRLLGADGFVNLIPTALLRTLDPKLFRAWCYTRGRYLVPTVELVEWLKDRIAGKKAIEVAAGMGDLGHHLGIPMSDSHCQTEPAFAAYYAALGQQPTIPPASVTKMEAERAVRLQKPDVVIASWLTQKYQPGDKDGCDRGADEAYIARRATYILIGNDNVHGDKRLMQKPHQTFHLPFIVSRASKPQCDAVYIWEKDHG